MKRLFVLRVSKRGNFLRNEGAPYFFGNKAEAKRAREAIRDDGRFPDVVVSYGPDHKLFKGE